MTVFAIEPGQLKTIMPLGNPNWRVGKCLFVIVPLTMFTGCGMKDFVWGLFGSAYSDGGVTDNDRNYHYEQKFEESNRAAAGDNW